MYPSQDARELSVLLRISRELDIVGDVTATVDAPAELLAWANILTDPAIVAWRAEEDRKSTRLNSSHIQKSRMPSSA